MNPIVQQDLARIAQEPLAWEDFAGTEVLVTGASGFLPAYMVETLLFLNRHSLSAPVRVTALVRNRDRASKRFAAYEGRDDLRLLVQDVSEPLQVSTRFHYVVHAASNASPSAYMADPAGTISANVLGSYHLLNLAAEQGTCKGFLFFSSGEVYGAVQRSDSPLREEDGGYLDPTAPRACYGESKRMGEAMAVAWARQYGVPTRIVRPGHTYGPGMRLEDGRVFADFVRDILRGGPIVMLSDGTARRAFCYLADATAAFFTVLLKGEDGQAYNVLNPEAMVRITDLADRLAVLYKHEGIHVERGGRPASAYIPSSDQGTIVSIQKIASLGWRPTTTIEEGFHRTVESYRQAGPAGTPSGSRGTHAE